jgi:site-specific recombinase XerD
LNNIDLQKARLTLNNGVTVRNLPIQAAQMGTLIYYINTIRPQFLEYCNGETDKLFFALSAEQYDKTFIAPLKKFKKQVKAIDRNFTGFNQIRTSVITHWIQADGLRKAQYLAGHKHINSTENYMPNDVTNLITEIQRFNPF